MIDLIEEATTAVAEYNATEAGLAALSKRLKGVAYDVTTAAGMAVAVKDRAEVRKLRTGLEAMRVEIKAPALERCRLIDAEAKRITGALLELERPIDDQIKVEESRKEAEKEAKRLAEILRRERNSAAIAVIRNRAVLMQGKTAREISEAIIAHVRDELGAVDADFHAVAQMAKDEALAVLRSMHQAAIDCEAEDTRRKAEADALVKERAELAQLRAEQDARDKAAREQILAEQRAADAARAEADRQAKALRDAEEARQRQERAEQQAKLDAERAEVRRQQDAADQVAREQRAAAIRAKEEKEATERADFIAKEDARRAQEEAAHAADKKGRDAWRTLAEACEMALEEAPSWRGMAIDGLKLAGRR